MLSLNFLSQERTYRLSLIQSLNQKGMSDKEISKYLNENSIKTPRNLNYYPELVFVTRKKLEKRNVRVQDTQIELSNLQVYAKNKNKQF